MKQSKLPFRLGVGLPNFGDHHEAIGLGNMARLIEDAEFDDLWLLDHVVMSRLSSSRYPYSGDGDFFLGPDSNWYESLVTLGYLAGITSTLQLGVGVLVVPQREPLLLAKQLASIDQLSNGRLVLGAGAGWLREEFDALGIDFESRGSRFNASLELIRSAWSGSPAAGEYGPFEVPSGIEVRPTPVRGAVPILIGGHSEAALRRAVLYGDGWYAAAGGNGFTPEDATAVSHRLSDLCEKHDRPFDELEMGVRYAPRSDALGTQELAELLHGYVAAGARRITIDLNWRSEEIGRANLEGLVATRDLLATP